MKKGIISVIVIAIILVVLIFAVKSQMTRTPEPKYQLVSSQNNIEVRQYSPMLIASVTIDGKRKKAIYEGFRTLADFIFGDNKSQQKIAMTAPVMQTNTGNDDQASWKVSFVMPADFNVENLPKPISGKINVQLLPETTMIVIRFSGRNSNENLAEHLTELDNYIKQNDIKVTGNPIYAFYNPPWILPFLRRNEIMYQVSGI